MDCWKNIQYPGTPTLSTGLSCRKENGPKQRIFENDDQQPNPVSDGRGCRKIGALIFHGVEPNADKPELKIEDLWMSLQASPSAATRHVAPSLLKWKEFLIQMTQTKKVERPLRFLWSLDR